MLNNNAIYPAHVIENFQNATADTENYKLCMTMIKYRMHMIDKVMRNEILIPYALFKLEYVYFQFRMVFELLYLSTIVARHKKFSKIWPASNRENDPAKIRKFVAERQKGVLEEHFPYPYQWRVKDSRNTICLLDKPISEKQIFDFFNKTHQYLHESNPYKKSLEQRQLECLASLVEAQEILGKMWGLLARHIRVSELANGQGSWVGCDFGEEHVPITLHEAVPG